MVERWQFAAWTLVVPIVAYFVVVQRPLYGVLAGALVYVTVWSLGKLGRPALLTDAFDTGRATATATVVLVVIGYALLVANQLLLGVLAAGTVLLVAWMTSPTGPFAGR